MIFNPMGGGGGGKTPLGELRYSYVKSVASKLAVPNFTYLTPDGAEQSVTGNITLPKTACMDGSVHYLKTHYNETPSKFDIPNTSFSIEGDTLVLTGYVWDAFA